MDRLYEFYLWKSSYFSLSINSIIAESLAALRAVKFCRKISFFNIIWKGDSLIGVKTLNSTDNSWCTYGQIVYDIIEVFHCFDSWQCCHTNRWANKIAHTLAKEGILNSNDIVWLNVIPNFYYYYFFFCTEIRAIVSGCLGFSL
jgi:hypothetical protein